MKHIYNYYSRESNHIFPDYYASFSKLRKPSEQHPVILLFDNEMVTGKRPLSDFLRHIKASDSDKHKIETELSVRLVPESNLYLLTNPLIDGKQECEIEHLFDAKTRAVEINGKTLCLKDQYDISKHYGKEKFSQYISQNYTQIDFSRFSDLLDKLSQIIESHSLM